MWRVALLLVACGGSSPSSTCSVEQLVAGDVSAADYFDCGTFTLGSENDTDEGMQAAQLCVLNAEKRLQGFRLVYDAADSSGKASASLRSGWSAVPAGNVLSYRNYASASNMITERACTTVVAATGCAPKVGIPCLACTGTQAGTIVCR